MGFQALVYKILTQLKLVLIIYQEKESEGKYRRERDPLERVKKGKCEMGSQETETLHLFPGQSSVPGR